MDKISYLKSVDMKKNKVDIASEAFDKGQETVKLIAEDVLKSYVSGGAILTHLMEEIERKNTGL